MNPKIFDRLKAICFLFCALVLFPVSAETDIEQAQEEEKAINSALTTLSSVLESSEEKLQDIKALKKELKKTTDKTDKEKLEESLKKLEADFDEIQVKLESIATGVAVNNYHEEEPEKFDLQKEFEYLIQPMIYALNSITQDSRQIEFLRQSIEAVEQRLEITTTATENLQKIIPKTGNKELKTKLEGMLDQWNEEHESLQDESSILHQQLQIKLDSKESLLSSTGEIFSGFFKSRGVNFILGLLTFFGVFFLLRFLFSLFKKLRYKDSARQRSTFERLIDLVFNASSFLIAFMATLFVFNLRNDWLLLGIGALFLLAVGWIVIKSLPSFVEQVMLLLNLGSVREGERLIYNGIPWQVKSLSFYTHFYNPVLTGGSLHISVRELLGMVSRPSALNEDWFPSKEQEWVKLEDGKLGQVIYQSPEMVEIELFGGSHITYTTENYLNLNPTNLSKGYRIQMIFGIDYKYQELCTTDIPDKMKALFSDELETLLGQDQIIKVATDFFQPNTSSLDFEYEAYIKGSSAHMYEEVERTMIYSFANVCNKYNWDIPFQQITLHQADKAD